MTWIYVFAPFTRQVSVTPKLLCTFVDCRPLGAVGQDIGAWMNRFRAIANICISGARSELGAAPWIVAQVQSIHASRKAAPANSSSWCSYWQASQDGLLMRRRSHAGLLALCLSLSAVLASFPGRAEPPTAYRTVAQAAGIPPQLLYAVAQTESITQLQIGHYPWPWTLNVAGKALRFETRSQACEALHRAINEQGVYAVDVGLTQQNWGYIGRFRFREPCDALHPIHNLRSAASLLRQYYQRTGNWITAAGLYHRPAGGAPARLYERRIRLRLEQSVGR